MPKRQVIWSEGCHLTKVMSSDQSDVIWPTSPDQSGIVTQRQTNSEIFHMTGLKIRKPGDKLSPQSTLQHQAVCTHQRFWRRGSQGCPVTSPCLSTAGTWCSAALQAWAKVRSLAPQTVLDPGQYHCTNEYSSACSQALQTVLDPGQYHCRNEYSWARSPALQMFFNPGQCNRTSEYSLAH